MQRGSFLRQSAGKCVGYRTEQARTCRRFSAMPIPPFQIPYVESGVGKHTCCLVSSWNIVHCIIMIPVGLDIMFSGAIVPHLLVGIPGWLLHLYSLDVSHKP